MKTFKITFFNKDLDVVEVKTYHNVANQSAMLENIETIIDTMGWFRAVKAEADGKNYTQALNYYLQ